MASRGVSTLFTGAKITPTPHQPIHVKVTTSVMTQEAHPSLFEHEPTGLHAEHSRTCPLDDIRVENITTADRHMSDTLKGCSVTAAVDPCDSQPQGCSQHPRWTAMGWHQRIQALATRNCWPASPSACNPCLDSGFKMLELPHCTVTFAEALD